jgi:drug/metabolite transporter (DMT)-like permease
VDATELAIVLLSALLHAGWTIAIKDSRDGLSFNLLQTLIAAAVGLSLVASVELSEIPTDLWPILAATGVAHGLYLYWLSRALGEADISLVYPIARSTPAFLPLAAIPLLGETLSWQGAAGIATVVAGMWLANLGRGLDWRAWVQPGIAFAYLTLATTVAYGLLDKAAMVHLNSAPWTSPVPRPIFYFFMLYLACAFVYVPLCLWRTGPAAVTRLARSEWRGVLFALVIGLASYGLILEALRTAPASYVVAVRQSSVLFVLALSILRLGERPGRPRIIGAGLTVAGVAQIAVAP